MFLFYRVHLTSAGWQHPSIDPVDQHLSLAFCRTLYAGGRHLFAFDCGDYANPEIFVALRCVARRLLITKLE